MLFVILVGVLSGWAAAASAAAGSSVALYGLTPLCPVCPAILERFDRLETDPPTETETPSCDMTVTAAAPPKTPSTALEMLGKVLVRHRNKKRFASAAVLQQTVPVPTAPSDADVKPLDADMSLPLLAHFPIRAVHVRLARLLMQAYFPAHLCHNETQLRAGGKVSMGSVGVTAQVRDWTYEQIMDSKSAPYHPSWPLLMRYKSWGECRHAAERAKTITEGVWKLYSFEYDGQTPPEAVCMYSQSHGSWHEQVVVGYNSIKVETLNCTLGVS